MENINQLKKLAQIFNTDKLISPEEIQQIFKGIVEILATYKKGTESINEDTKKAVNKLLENVIFAHEESLQKAVNTVLSEKEKLANGFTEKLTELKLAINSIKEEMDKEDDALEEDTDDEEEKQALIEEIMAQITLPEVKATIVSGEEIIDKINELPLDDDNKIDYARLKNVPVIKGKVISGSPTVISNAVDLDGTTRANGYAITWDATRGRYTHTAATGGASPLTTKGDLYTYSTTDARLGVGTDGQVLTADSAEATGLKWTTVSGTGDVVGPASSTDNALVRFDGTTGKLLQNSAIIITDADAVSGISTFSTTSNGAFGTSPTNARLIVNGGTRSGTYYGVTGFYSAGGTYTDTSSTGTVATHAGNFFSAPTFAASNATTYTNASTLYIGAAPIASTNVTLTNSYAFWVDSGTSRLDGDVLLNAQTASTIAILDASKNLISATTATYPSLTEFSYVKGVSSAIQTQLDGKQATIGYTPENQANKSSSTSLGTSDTLYPTQNAVKTYVDNAVTGLLDLKGDTDCSANPNYPAASKGDSYYVTVAGKIGGASGKVVEVGDVYVAKADNAGGTEASVGTSWFVLNQNLSGVALTSGTLAQFASTTSLQLAGVISDETGSGSLVFGTSPTLVTPLMDTIQTTGSSGVAIKNSGGATVLTIGPANGTGITTAGQINVGGSIVPSTNDVGALGSSTNQFSDLFLAEGGVINWDNGDATITQSGNTITIAGITSLDVGTSTATTTGTIELGAASDTTLSRSSAGQLAVEGVLVATETNTATLSNKTLTAPKFADLGFIADANGNEMIIFDTTTSAVNEITVANAATGNAPSITASGETNVDLNIGAKGTGQVKHTTATYQAPVAATDGVTITFDVSDGNIQTVTLGGNRTLAISNAKVGQVFMLRLLQDGTGSRTVTWFTTIKWAGGSAPTLTTTANKADVFGFLVTSSGNYDGFVVGQNI